MMERGVAAGGSRVSYMHAPESRAKQVLLSAINALPTTTERRFSFGPARCLIERTTSPFAGAAIAAAV